MSEPLISVVVAAFDRREFVRDAVRSVLAQSLRRAEYELVVIKNFDDPEVDALRGEAGVKILRDESPAVGAMLLEALDATEGEVVCFLDDDDLFEPTKLERIARLFREDPSLVFVHDSILPVDRRGTPIPGGERIRAQPTASYAVATAADRRGRASAFFRYGSNVNLSAMSIRASLLRGEANRFRRVHASPDIFVFFAALASRGTLWIERDQLTRYRFHSSWSHAQVDAGRGSFEAQRLVHEVETAELIAAMTEGTPARPAALGYVTEARFQYYLMVPRAASPTWRQYLDLGRAAWVRRQPYLADRAFWALSKRIAPTWTTQKYHERSHQRQFRMLAP